jgi:hypothetical protein
MDIEKELEELDRIQKILSGKSDEIEITEEEEADEIASKYSEFNGHELPKWGETFPDDELIGEEWIAEKSAKRKKLKDPKGGLTPEGRAYFKRTQGSNLKPGVKGPADTPDKMRRKGSFLTRFFTNPSGPLKDEKGRATRLALSAAAWGEPVPQNMEDAEKLAAKGRRLLERYSKVKRKSIEEDIEIKKFSIMDGESNEDAVVRYLDLMSDEDFDKMFPEDNDNQFDTEEKWIFDVAGAFLRRAITGRRKRRRRKR